MTDSPKFVQHLAADNDSNGNPRRVWAVYGDRGEIVTAIDEGYGNLPSEFLDLPQLPTIHITPAEYREWLDRIEHLSGRFEVVERGDGFVWHRFYTRARALKFRREHYKSDELEVREVAR